MATTSNRAVLILADGMPAGGTERQIVALLKGFKEHCPHIYTLFGVLVKGGAREGEAHFWANEVVSIPQSHQLDISMAWSVTGLVKKHKIDIIHTFGSISDLAGVVAAKLTGAKLVNGSIRSARRRLTRRDRLSKFAMRFADRVVANSQAGLRAFGVEKWRSVSVIYNGLDQRRFDTVKPFLHSAPYLCMVGNFTAKKDHQALIKAFPEIRKRFRHYHLFLIGKGELEKACQDLIGYLGLQESVVIINDCSAPESYIKGAAVCILLSPDGEGLSNVVMEYCVLGKPVVATNLGGNSEIIEHGVSGILLESHSQLEISRTLLALLSDEAKCERLANQAKQTIREKFSLERMIAEYVQLYEQLLSSDR
ncbi:glycosyltransferase family 4 protein [Desulfogranum marinum]|uniref:glycosyltransferase family 4 protein n=1 Tax=Desulfogranum marinum TaxID=453220 RepID=UPI001964D2AE|nr:glycosyltransferase family 4 protein [Desulfogranum marinum]MBM9512999.1 glycosyltransferase family 4 protein [Desulfogranum marinum]